MVASLKSEPQIPQVIAKELCNILEISTPHEYVNTWY